MRGLVIAGTHSDVGKTVTTLAVCRALGTTRVAKAGPDFIDPSHHTAVTGDPSRTLDPWLCGVEGTRRNYYRGANENGAGECCVIEGMMGLYDGTVSTARVAEVLDVPVILVVDASAGMESVAASALGFRRYAEHAGRAIDVVGIIAQRAHGGRHERGIRDALPDSLAYFGRIPPREDLEIPSRHLGLHMGQEAPLSEDALDATAAHIDADGLRSVARAPPSPTADEREHNRAPTGARDKRTEPRIAVARDDAFCFVYPAVRECLREQATVIPFAPTAGDDLPPCDGVYLPGGYPEKHATALAASPALDTIRERAIDGLPVFGECGGLMALSESLTVDGETHAMAGVLPAEITLCDQYQALDHVELEATRETLTARVGETFRGHEFHYSRADVANDARFAFDVRRGTGIDDEHDGLTEYQTLGTYCHVHAECGAFDQFVKTVGDT
ncbi:cobyrinic acid a,c-diamide synthase [Halocatena marina]|uniref:cobyrinic acid a,c-diamide synthase n=1 Tax=Halocatena marina TaxID=2934937 RepID=UPI00222571B2|nr:cobyrinic acid a,c-diamide synthase [Halocatena marina]